MTMINNIEMECPVCGKKTPQPVLFSTNTFGYPDLDLRPAPMQRDTMDTWILECPNCGYVSSNFDSEPTITKDFLKSDAYTTCDGIEFKGKLAKRFYRNYLIAKHNNNAAGCFNNLLHCAWDCDDKEDPNAAHVRKLALPYITGLIEIDSEGKNNYLAMKADLMRRCGEFDQLINEYSDIITGEEIINRVIQFQIQKAKEKDTTCYTVEDVVNEDNPKNL